MRSSRQVFSISRSFSAPSNTTHPFCCCLARYVGKSSFATGMKEYPRSLAYIAAKAAIFLPDSATMTTFSRFASILSRYSDICLRDFVLTWAFRLARRRTNPFHRFCLRTPDISSKRHFRSYMGNSYPYLHLFEMLFNIFIRQRNVHLIRT